MEYLIRFDFRGRRRLRQRDIQSSKMGGIYYGRYSDVTQGGLVGGVELLPALVVFAGGPPVHQHKRFARGQAHSGEQERRRQDTLLGVLSRICFAS